VQPFSR